MKFADIEKMATDKYNAYKRENFCNFISFLRDFIVDQYARYQTVKDLRIFKNRFLEYEFCYYDLKNGYIVSEPRFWIDYGVFEHFPDFSFSIKTKGWFFKKYYLKISKR